MSAMVTLMKAVDTEGMKVYAKLEVFVSESETKPELLKKMEDARGKSGSSLV